MIVGAGSAGCRLAQLLAEGQAGNVALIEAGRKTTDVRSTVPNFYPRTFGSQLDWNFSTVPQPALGGRRLHWPRGKLLGGSGAINALIFLQAAQQDFATWGWQLGPQLERELQSVEDSLPLSTVSKPHPWTTAFLGAAAASGLQVVDRWTQARANTCGYFQLTQRAGRRVHAGHWLSEAKFDNDDMAQVGCNLHFFADHHIHRLCFDETSLEPRVRGVEVWRADGTLETVWATDEVLLCAGTIGSPQVLMRSGIGDADMLAQAQIPCLCDSKWVGQNLQDHLVFPLVFRTRSPAGLPRRHTRAARNAYRVHGAGSLASNIAEAGALFVHSESNDRDPPAFQIHFTPTHYLKYPQLESGDMFLSLAVTDLHPQSRGSLRLVRQHDRELLQIDPNYLTVASDVGRFEQAIHWARQLATHGELQQVIDTEVSPSAKCLDAKSVTKSLAAFARSIYHPVGTCRMASAGLVGPANSVVDQHFCVHGISGLRVVDASVLPTLPSGNTNAAVLLIATQAARALLDC